jgi:hypothetical protein
MGGARVVALQTVTCVPFGALSALRYVHMVYTPVIADHFPVCLPRRTPVDSGKGSRGNSKALPNSDEPERPHHDLFSSPRTRNEHIIYTLHIARAPALR